jgi:hypothetical protein
MSLPDFSTQSELFSTAALSGGLFAANDRYRLFAQKIYPVLAQTRSQLEAWPRRSSRITSSARRATLNAGFAA